MHANLAADFAGEDAECRAKTSCLRGWLGKDPDNTALRWRPRSAAFQQTFHLVPEGCQRDGLTDVAVESGGESALAIALHGAGRESQNRGREKFFFATK